MNANHMPGAPIDRAQILKAASSLGVLGEGPHSAPRIMAALCNPDTGTGEIADLVGREPALYARVLRVANSPYYGQMRSIRSVERAVVVLGRDAVRGIAAAACLDRTVPRIQKQSLVDMRAVLHHSLASAAAAEALARLRQEDLASDAFIAGLLHNLGIIVQVYLDTPGIQAMIALRAAGDRRSMRALESEHSNVGHEECIGVIFEEWQLPDCLIAAARAHHDPMGAPDAYRSLASLTNLGATLGLASGSVFTLEPEALDRNVAAMGCLGLDDGHLNGIAELLPERVAELRKALLDG